MPCQTSAPNMVCSRCELLQLVERVGMEDDVAVYAEHEVRAEVHV